MTRQTMRGWPPAPLNLMKAMRYHPAMADVYTPFLYLFRRDTEIFFFCCSFYSTDAWESYRVYMNLCQRSSCVSLWKEVNRLEITEEVELDDWFFVQFVLMSHEYSSDKMNFVSLLVGGRWICEGAREEVVEATMTDQFSVQYWRQTWGFVIGYSTLITLSLQRSIDCCMWPVQCLIETHRLCLSSRRQSPRL